MGALIAVTASSDMESALPTARDMRALGVSAWPGLTDLADRLSVDTAMLEMVTALGRLDMVVNNAAPSRPGSGLELSTDH